MAFQVNCLLLQVYRAGSQNDARTSTPLLSQSVAQAQHTYPFDPSRLDKAYARKTKELPDKRPSRFVLDLIVS